MFKKKFVILGAVAVMVCAIFIPQVRAAAESALSIFRVRDTRTIRISVNDLGDMLTFINDKKMAVQQGDDMEEILSQIIKNAEPEVKTLSDVRDFKAFPFSLPAALKDETPALSAVDSQAASVILDTEKLNAALTGLDAAALLDSSLNGTEITVNTPPAIMAEYEDVQLAATQTVYIDAPAAAMNSLRSSFLSIPAIPDGLRTQLAAIDPDTRDVYLPVIEGLGRETDLGGTTGYVYSSGDLAQVMGMLPGFADDAHLTQLQNENAAVLIWVKNGVLYCLAGEMSDSALSQIARSVR